MVLYEVVFALSLALNGSFACGFVVVWRWGVATEKRQQVKEVHIRATAAGRYAEAVRVTENLLDLVRSERQDSAAALKTVIAAFQLGAPSVEAAEESWRDAAEQSKQMETANAPPWADWVGSDNVHPDPMDGALPDYVLPRTVSVRPGEGVLRPVRPSPNMDGERYDG